MKGSSLKSSKIKWVIENPEILAFEDGITSGTEVEVVGLQEGTTNVIVNNLHTGGQLAYTVNVVPDYDD